MGIKDKQTYGEYYWAMQVEAAQTFADDSEKAVAPYLASLLADVVDIELLPMGVQNFLRAMSEPPSFAFLPFMAGVGVNAIDEMLDVAFEPALLGLKREYGKRFKSKWLTVAEVNTLWARKKVTEGLWDEVVAAEGYEPVLGTGLFESQLPYPSIPELVLYSRYHGDPDAPWGQFQNWYNISPRDWPVWKWLGQQKLTTEQLHTAYRRGYMSEPETLYRLAQVGWNASDRQLLKDLNWQIPNAMLMVQGGLMEGLTYEELKRDISFADIHPKYKGTYLNAVLTKPASIDIVNYQLRKDPALDNLEQQLLRIGIHPQFADVYKTLAYQIPPVADIITMAVREAFTPDIAARFGQYEDFPPQLEQYAAMKGLTKEWSERYWAAHWSLPSPQQGFEMLHRGIINTEELSLLLRALDVMPFWRDKLIQMSYRPLTRVDVRRMYRQGVLDEREVLDAYKDVGYADDNAERMTRFTIRQTLATMSKFTSRDVITAYTKRLISRGESASLLRMLEIRSEDIEYILSTADYKRNWAMTEQQTRGIRNLYKRQIYSEDEARDKLSRLALPSDQINTLIEQWYYEIAEEEKPTWTTAQTLKFAKTELITKERAVKELQVIGYDKEHIDIYMESIKSATNNN